MATIYIFKKNGDEVKQIVQEDALTIYTLIIGDESENYQRKKFVDSILLTLVDGRKIGFNPRIFAYYND